MRILIANENRNLVGGIEKYLQILIPALLDRGHETALLYENAFDPDLEKIDPAGLPAWRAEKSSTASMLACVSEWKPSVVYSHGLQGPALEGALLDAFPTVLYGHNYYGTCVSGRKCHSFPSIQSCERRFGPACMALYYPRRCGGMHPGTAWKLYRRQSELHSRLRQSQAVLVASHHMHREYHRNGVSLDKLHLVPLPASVESSERSTAPNQDDQRRRILFVGRLTDLKGAGYLIQAIPQAAQELGRPLTLTIAGDGPERFKLEKLAGELKLAAEFAGWVPTSRKLDLMRCADLLAVPSLWPEPFGLVGLEAACLGVPAVGYAMGGIPDWLIPSGTGELAPSNPPTVRGLADAIVRALKEPSHYSALCRGAWELSREFTLERHMAQLNPILETASAGGGSTRYEAAHLTA